MKVIMFVFYVILSIVIILTFAYQIFNQFKMTQNQIEYIILENHPNHPNISS